MDDHSISTGLSNCDRATDIQTESQWHIMHFAAASGGKNQYCQVIVTTYKHRNKIIGQKQLNGIYIVFP